MGIRARERFIVGPLSIFTEVIEDSGMCPLPIMGTYFFIQVLCT